MATIRALILGDDPLARSRVRAVLAAQDDIEVVDELESDLNDPAKTGHLVSVDVDRWTPPRQRFVVRNRDHIAFVKATAVEWISAEGNYARLHAGGQSHLMRESLQKLETQLDPALFVRVHRSAIINIDQVSELVSASEGGWSIVLHDGTSIHLGATFRERLESVLGQRL